MRLVNKTKYNGTDLRAFITWVSNEEGWTPAMRKRLSVEVVPSQKWCSGVAWTGAYHIELRIPKPERLEKIKFASLVAHELKHLTNKEHVHISTERWMRSSSRYGYNGNERHWSGAEALAMRFTTPGAKPKATSMDKATAGLKHAQEKVEEYNRKIRLAENRLKKWSAKAKYYERRTKLLELCPESEPKERKKPVPSEKTLLRRAINKHITTELENEDRQKWEVYSMLTDKCVQASGLRASFEDEWEGDFTELKYARKIVNPGETMMLRGYKDDGYWGECEITIPSREELLGEFKAAARKGKA